MLVKRDGQRDWDLGASAIDMPYRVVAPALVPLIISTRTVNAPARPAKRAKTAKKVTHQLRVVHSHRHSHTHSHTQFDRVWVWMEKEEKNMEISLSV